MRMESENKSRASTSQTQICIVNTTSSHQGQLMPVLAPDIQGNLTTVLLLFLRGLREVRGKVIPHSQVCAAPVLIMAFGTSKLQQEIPGCPR